MRLRFLEIARLELRQAYNYYEEKQKFLGLRFIEEIKDGLGLITKYPKSCQKISKNTRRVIIKTFPYCVVYQIRKDYILVVAIANLHRKPNYWVDRV